MNHERTEVRLPSWMKAALTEVARETGTPESAIIVRILELRLRALGYLSPLEAMLEKVKPLQASGRAPSNLLEFRAQVSPDP